MKNISGDIDIMALPDIMQWAEVNRKTGTLTFRYQGISKMFYFQDGKIIFVSSQKEGERLGEFLINYLNLDTGTVREAIKESQRLGIPFTGYLISEHIVEKNTLEDAMARLAESVFADALAWNAGTFEFTGDIPAFVLNGPVKLRTSFVVFQSVKTYDETRGKEVPDVESMMKKITRKITEGEIDIPPIPDIMMKLNEYFQRDDFSLQDVAKLIMADQIMTSKILKVVNSPFYSPPSNITSLQQAIIYMGFKSILSIVTVHALNSINIKSNEEVAEVLRHSLLCAFISKRIAISSGIDPEEAFVCGLLHDIGKTVLLNLLEEYSLPREARYKIVNEYHLNTGSLIAIKWNFSEIVKYAIRFHHNPEDALAHVKTVEAVALANAMANEPENGELGEMKFKSLNVKEIDVNQIRKEIGDIQKTVKSLI